MAELFAAVEEGNLSELEDLFSEPGVDPNMSNKVRGIISHRQLVGTRRLSAFRDFVFNSCQKSFLMRKKLK